MFMIFSSKIDIFSYRNRLFYGLPYRITGRDHTIRNIFIHNTSGTNDGIVSDCHARQHEYIRSNPDIVSHCDWQSNFQPLPSVRCLLRVLLSKNTQFHVLLKYSDISEIVLSCKCKYIQADPLIHFHKFL